MTPKANLPLVKSPADLLEEAIALLRAIPSSLVLYYVGAVPFWIGFLFFIADMGRSAYAAERLVSSSLGMAALFLWAKCWQAVFAGRLRTRLLGVDPGRWTFGRIARLMVSQISLQPWGLWIRTVALVITFPFVWVSSFYHNATVLGDPAGDLAAGESLFARALRQALLWPRQAHVVFSWLSLFGLFVWLNVITGMVAIPMLLKMVFDIETAASKNLGALLYNSTFHTTAFALTVLCLDPIWKAVYVLRCFYGESVRSGADLKAELQLVNRGYSRAAAVVAMSVLLMVAPVVHAEAEGSARPHAATVVDKGDLDRSISDVLGRREYAWRAARQEREQQSGWLKDFTTWIKEISRKIRDAIWDYLKKLRRERHRDAPDGSQFLGSDIVILLLAIALVPVVILLLRMARQRKTNIAQAQPLAAQPDLEAHDLTADQLPEEGWLRMMQEMLASGQLRLALRAAYLAGLSHLGHRNLISLARHKSNRDYANELRRRARDREGLLSAFGENLAVFERAWYGSHEVTLAAIDRFRHNLEVIRGR